MWALYRIAIKSGGHRMKVRSAFITPAIMTGVVVGFVLLGTPSPSIATEPHVCINGQPATQWQNLASTTQIKWGYGGACNHNANVIKWYFYVYNYNPPYNTICSATNGGSGWSLPPDTELHTVACAIPKGATVKLRARVWYQVVGSGWMSFDDLLTNN